MAYFLRRRIFGSASAGYNGQWQRNIVITDSGSVDGKTAGTAESRGIKYGNAEHKGMKDKKKGEDGKKYADQ